MQDIMIEYYSHPYFRFYSAEKFAFLLTQITFRLLWAYLYNKAKGVLPRGLLRKRNGYLLHRNRSSSK